MTEQVRGREIVLQGGTRTVDEKGHVNQIARCLHQGRLLPKGTRVAFDRLRALPVQLLPQAYD